MAGKKGGVVVVMVIPVEGETVRKEVPRTPGMTVGEALAAAGVSPENRNLTVTKLAKANDPIKDGDVINVTEPVAAGQVVKVTERVAGS